MNDRWNQFLRAAAGLTAVMGLVWGWRAFGGPLAKAYEVWRYPGITARSPLGDALKAQVDGVRRAELTGLYKRVMTMLDEAERDGFSVADLRGRLPDAARMIRSGQFEYARVLLSSVEARVPKKRERVVATAAEPEAEEAPAPPPPKPLPRPKARRRPRSAS